MVGNVILIFQTIRLEFNQDGKTLAEKRKNNILCSLHHLSEKSTKSKLDTLFLDDVVRASPKKIGYLFLGEYYGVKSTFCV